MPRRQALMRVHALLGATLLLMPLLSGAAPGDKEARSLTPQEMWGDVGMQDLTPMVPTKKPVEIVATSNLLALDATMADTGPGRSTAPATSQTKYDARFSICQAVAPTGDPDFPAANALTPAAVGAAYFNSRGITFDLNEPATVTLVEGPKHGKLELLGPYVYQPSQGYLGPDQMTFTVEVKGKIFRVIYSVEVVHAPDYGSPGCPGGIGIKELPKKGTKGSGGSSSKNILELPADESVDLETFTQLHRMLSFSSELGSVDGGVQLSFTDLSGGAVGQTTGTSISLDTTAAENGVRSCITTGLNQMVDGNVGMQDLTPMSFGWYIDPTPLDNTDDYLPTSNPDVWQAKAGSGAAGKMDLLSGEWGQVLHYDRAEPNG